MSKEIDIDHLRTWVGKQSHQQDSITTDLLNRFQNTLDGFARWDHVQPLGLHWCLAPVIAAPAELGPDGHPARGGFMPPVPLERRMWASSNIRFHQTPVLDIAIEKSSTIADVTLKESAKSGPLIFVNVTHSYTQEQEGNPLRLIEEEQTIVYRTAAPFRAASPMTSPAGLLHTHKTVPDSTLLFRYSAITFNGHRIHYDHPYTTSVEGYPDLVVHGPLMATLLMNFARFQRPGRPMQQFSFRGVAPAFVDQPLILGVQHYKENDETLTLEIRNEAGAQIMQANAVFAT